MLVRTEDDQVDRGRDQNAERASGRSEPGTRLIVVVAAHQRHRHRADRGCRGDARAGRGGNCNACPDLRASVRPEARTTIASWPGTSARRCPTLTMISPSRMNIGTATSRMPLCTAQTWSQAPVQRQVLRSHRGRSQTSSRRDWQAQGKQRQHGDDDHDEHRSGLATQAGCQLGVGSISSSASSSSEIEPTRACTAASSPR